jgi:type IX secretion system PorP/SprF family membrane protein
MIKKILYFGLVCARLNSVFGQQDEQISFYQYTTLSYNPAFAGVQGKVSATTLGRFQWIQFTGAPKSQLLSVHSSIAKNRIGIGGNIKHDQIGKRSRTDIDINLASALILNKKNDLLRLGVSLGLNQYAFDFGETLVNDPGDPIETQLSLTVITAGFGIYYAGKKQYLGISIPHLLPGKGKSSQQLLSFSTPHVYVSGGYEFRINDHLNMKTSSLLKYVPHVPLTMDVTATFIYREKLFGGVGYRLKEGIVLNGLVQLKQHILIGYSYEIPINGLLNHQSGSHELMLQYIMKEKKEADGIPKF